MVLAEIMEKQYLDRDGNPRDPYDWELAKNDKRSALQKMRDNIAADNAKPKKPATTGGIFMAVVLALIFFFIVLPLLFWGLAAIIVF